MDGWIKIHRQLAQHELWLSERFTRGQAWADLLLLANHRPNTIFIRGNEVHTERGELAYSMKSLAKRWQWNRRTVKRFLSLLGKRKMIHSRNNHLTTVISILNYNRYQSTTQQSAQQSSSRVHTNKNVENHEESTSLPHETRQQPRDSRKVSTNGSQVAAFKTWWQTESNARTGAAYLFNHGKEGKLVLEMLAACGNDLNRLKAKARTFLSQDDDFVRKAGHTLGVMRSRFNSLNPNQTKSDSTNEGPTGTERILIGEVSHG